MKQRVTIVNEERGTSAMLLLDRQTCRLSVRQARETFQKLAIPGFEKAGELGEWPIQQKPPECGGVAYHVVKVGDVEDGMSNVYFVPVGTMPEVARREPRRRRGAPAHKPTHKPTNGSVTAAGA